VVEGRSQLLRALAIPLESRSEELNLALPFFKLQLRRMTACLMDICEVLVLSRVAAYSHSRIRSVRKDVASSQGAVQFPTGGNGDLRRKMNSHKPAGALRD